MKRFGFFLLGMLVISALGAAFVAYQTRADNINADYSGTPPFVAATVTPNILLIMDNSGSMAKRAFCDLFNDTLSEPGKSKGRCDDPTFNPQVVSQTEVDARVAAVKFYSDPTDRPGADEGAAYAGMFNSLKCYTYDVGNTRFVPVAGDKATLASKCGDEEWDGHLLNWITFRRMDALKKTMTGGTCVVPRDVDGLCPPSGSPDSLITLKGQDVFGALSSIDVTTPGVPKGTSNGYEGRVPESVFNAVAPSDEDLHFHVMGSGALAGSFCVDQDNDATVDPTIPGSCDDGAPGVGIPEKKFVIHVAVPAQPAGVLHDLGDKARFGLMEFRLTNEGGRVLTPIGGRQAVSVSSATVTTYNSNKAAMLASVDQTEPLTNTPLAETLYTAIRYVAQLPQPFLAAAYQYPVAFAAGGVTFNTNGQGSIGNIGSAELSTLTGSETCPGFFDAPANTKPTGYLTNACGRDPFFYGSDNQPAWASPSSVVTCCKTFILVLTDGEPTFDQNVPASLQDFASAVHGTKCTGTTAAFSPGPPVVADPTNRCYNGTTADQAGEASILLHQHKTDYGNGGSHFLDDVAYWGHTTDLRQATIPPLGESGNPLDGFQNVTVYTFFAFGTIEGREILMQTARQGGFEDTDGTKTPNLSSEFDKVNNNTGVAGSDGLPDTYFESSNVEDIRDKLLAAITSILQKSASGTSVSVLATSSTGEGAIYQAFFFPVTFNTEGSVTTEVLWRGFTQGLFVDTFGNLREDYSTDCAANANNASPSAPDGVLNLKHDCIIKIRFDPDTNEVAVDRFTDGNGDGVADGPPVATNVKLKDLRPMWEAGTRLALTNPGAACPENNINQGIQCRRILASVDLDNDGLNNNEVFEFISAFDVGYCPYLGGKAVKHCTSSDPGLIGAAAIAADPSLKGCNDKTRQQCATDEATGIINFIRGCDPADTFAECQNGGGQSTVKGLRSRQVKFKDDPAPVGSGAAVTRTWKLGDIIHSTPVVIGAPNERFDVVYGDEGYNDYFQRYKDRRQVAYVGANDGMLHAFNAGFFRPGDDPGTGTIATPVIEQLQFTKVPLKLNTPGNALIPCSQLPCDRDGTGLSQYAFRSNSVSLKLGSEMWAFIPQDLLPHLQWLTSGVYDHTYYVDLKPKITDARIFTPDDDHPGGWGTILIGGFRLGGSCTNCQQGKAKPRVVTGDFDYDGDTTDPGDTRVFLSSYFVLDVTNPEKDPVLLWTFRDKDLGLTTAEPAVLRVSPSKTDIANERWYVVFGTGPTHHDADTNGPTQEAQLFVVNLKDGPTYDNVNRTSGTVRGTACDPTNPCITADITSPNVRLFSTGAKGFMGDAVTLDVNLDFRVDVAYAGSTLCNGPTPVSCTGSAPQWKGKMHRVITKGSTDLAQWELSTLISQFTSFSASPTCLAESCLLGPVTSVPTLTLDDNQDAWVFFGTGRFYSNNDKINPDPQRYFGVKDSFLTLGSPNQTVERNELFDSTDIVVCTSCGAENNVSVTGSESSFTIGFDAGPNNLLNTLQNLDGWFTSLPLTGERNLSRGTLIGGTLFFTTFVPVPEICTASGNGFLYSLYYQTGGAYKEATLDTETVGDKKLAKKSISLGTGLPSQMAVQIGSQGTGASGTVSGSGCSGRITGFIQASTGVLGQTCGSAALSFYSRLLSWRDL